MSEEQEQIREWLRDELSQRPRGTKLRLAERLGFTRPDAITRMLNTNPNKETRGIKAHELEVMREFFSSDGAERDLSYDKSDPAAPEPIDPDQEPTWSVEGEHQGIPDDASPQVDVTAGMGGGGVPVIAEGVPGKAGMTFAREVISDHWRFPSHLLSTLGTRARDLAMLPVQGDSMTPSLDEGDFVLVDTRHRFPSPDGVYAIADDFGGIVVKRLEVARTDDGERYVMVLSDNPKHSDHKQSLDELHIVGRVVRRFTAELG